MHLSCRGRVLDLTRPAVMGVLNVTADSFSDGGRFRSFDAAVTHGAELVAQGAAIIDVGGESTRPGAEPVSVHEELDRVVPVIEALSRRLDVLLSVDTMKPEVMPGEKMTVRLIKPGESVGQGVGYLDDGTMVVVEGGRPHLNEDVEFTVTNTRQTVQGRMIFGRLGSNGSDQAPKKPSPQHTTAAPK